MSKVIEVENLGKKYIITHQRQEQYTTLRDVIVNSAKKATKKIIHPSRTKKVTVSKYEEFWALKNISFDIEQGDRVGIIGRNGAGKTTLLKILSRITEPTEGRVKIKGRVASLLEVGTGFHPELTGRENIFLNGAILGMSKTEIKKKFDEIVNFAGVEKFLDTPVKRYSSGMYVRLAFAVAAHLEPDMLLIDEVLSVGDLEFQKKCLGKMEEVGKEGRTVLFVSHNLSAIEHLCNRGILLENGRLVINDDVNNVTRNYLQNVRVTAENVELDKRADRNGSGKIKAVSFKVLDINFNEVHSLRSGDDYCFEIGYLNNIGEAINNVVVSFDIYDDKDMRVLLYRTNFTNSNLALGAVSGKILCKVNNLPLANGTYHFSIFISHGDDEIFDSVHDIAYLNVEGGDFFGTGSYGLPTHCKILAKAEWLNKTI